MRGTRLPSRGGGRRVSSRSRVYLRPPAHADRHEFVKLMRASRSFHRPWATAPTDDERFAAYLADSRRPDFEAMLVCRHEDDAIVGFFNISQIVRRTLQSAYLGYAAGKPYAGQRLHAGRDRARPTPSVHDLRSCTGSRPTSSPGNRASIALAQGAGFRREGFSPRYLKIGGRWRDHERWALLAEEWRQRNDVDGDRLPVDVAARGRVRQPSLDSGPRPT